MAPALRMTRLIKETLPVFLFKFHTSQLFFLGFESASQRPDSEPMPNEELFFFRRSMVFFLFVLNARLSEKENILSNSFFGIYSSSPFRALLVINQILPSFSVNMRSFALAAPILAASALAATGEDHTTVSCSAFWCLYTCILGL